MPAEIIENLAKNILDKVDEQIKPEDKYGIDPITIIMLIGLALTLIRIVQECRKDKVKLFGSRSEKTDYITTEVKSLCFNRSLITRMRLRKIVKNHLTREQYKVYGDALIKSVLETGKNLTQEQAEALLEYKNV